MITVTCKGRVPVGKRLALKLSSSSSQEVIYYSDGTTAGNNMKYSVTKKWPGKFEGKRSRGRQREKIMDGLATWLGPGKVSDILAAVKDRDLWRDMIANAYKQGT
ncbi:hypothetical protein PoB_005575000 [Plakobranchus ocellatus]|uniref:Uncharacterized protein n=1 Tax=Plakobranchus ocellatus TaxID=259542 RepID=A0AAV4C966_9GAST|nr:hypothetical protein PoB_005575000 [Plakobranchus ocellatus]